MKLWWIAIISLKMRGTDFTRRFGERLRVLRNARGMSQEQLAAAAGLHRTHVSLIERNHRSVRLESLERLARALRVDPSELIPGYRNRRRSPTTQHHPDLEKLQSLFPYIREYQSLASKHGIGDIFQDNGGKLLQTLLILNMQGLGCREGNDCRDADGNEYELKSVNLLLTKGVSTHHHLNPTILKKYRAVKAWYFSFYEGIELVEMWRVETTKLEPWLKKNEQKWHRSGGKDINNPKIAVNFVREVGKRVY